MDGILQLYNKIIIYKIINNKFIYNNNKIKIFIRIIKLFIQPSVWETLIEKKKNNKTLYCNLSLFMKFYTII